MQLIRKLLARRRSLAGRNQKIRGLSTAELVGIIVIVGILGALGGTYVTGLVTSAKNNTGNQNAQNLQTVMTSAIAGGAKIGTGGGGSGNLDLTSTATAWADLVTTGVTVTDANNNTVTYQVNPPPQTAASYKLTGGSQTAADPGTWTFTSGATP